MSKEKQLSDIVEEIFKLESPQIEESRKEKINKFIVSTVNGDEPIAHLAVNTSLGKDKDGVIAYILTDKRLIKIEIDSKDVQSASFKLSTIVSVRRKLIDADREQFDIYFQNDSFGLKYPTVDKRITEFFQKIEQHYLDNS